MDGKATTVWQQKKNYSWWWRGNIGADNNDNKTTINKCAAAEGKNDDGRQEAGACWRRWRRDVSCTFIYMVVSKGGKLYLNHTSSKRAQNSGRLIDFGGVFWACFKVRVRLGSFLRFWGHPTPNHTKIVPWIVPKSCWEYGPSHILHARAGGTFFCCHRKVPPAHAPQA